MKRQVMQPFRAPRKGKAQSSPTRQSPRRGQKQDQEVHVVPYIKGIRMMSDREATECAQHGEVLRWSSMSAIQILKHVLAEGLWKKKGWLFLLLQREGITDGSKARRKELCWQYYKSQLLYIEAVQDAKGDSTFDPRRSDHRTGKDGKFVKSKKGTVKPKNALTVTYLCYAFDVPYATFKRWKLDAGLTTSIVPVNKGKSVITDKTWASQIYTARRMYISHSMAVWVDKHPARKHDVEGKKVGVVVYKFTFEMFHFQILHCDMLHFIGEETILSGEMEDSQSRAANSVRKKTA